MTTYKIATINYFNTEVFIVMVDDTVISQEIAHQNIYNSVSSLFSTPHVYLAGKDVFGKFTYWGLSGDILDFLCNQDINSFRWRIVRDKGY